MDFIKVSIQNDFLKFKYESPFEVKSIVSLRPI